MRERKPLHRPLASHLHFPSLVPVSLSKRHDAQRISYPHPRHSRDDAHAVPDLRPARPLRARPPETKVFPSSQRALRPLVTLPSAPDPRARAIDRPPMFPTRVQPRALRSRPSLVPVRRSHERGWIIVSPRASVLARRRDVRGRGRAKTEKRRRHARRRWKTFGSRDERGVAS